MRRLLRDLKGDDNGVTMVEYALIAGLVSIVAVVLLAAIGTSVTNIFSNVNSGLTAA
jgi:pilus assembly protein Flp/PilA